jgi:PPM family protein phosphatase
MIWTIESALDSYRSDSQDRLAILNYSYGSLLLVADGMGGRRGGAEAAEYVIHNLSRSFESLSSPISAIETMNLLIQMDREMSRISSIGETTIVCGFLTTTSFQGAAVGDSVAWWIDDQQCINLTNGSEPKPWMGSGQAFPKPFSMPLTSGSLLLSTDGLTKFVDPNRICEIIRQRSSHSIPQQLIDEVRLRQKSLPDDIGLIFAYSSP